MFDFFKALFKPVPSSSVTAKERLRLVLLSDHISLSPETIDALKADLLEVIARYVVIDPAQADVTFEQRDHDLAMLASVPITAIRDSRPRAAPLPPSFEVHAEAAGLGAPADAQIAHESAKEDASGPAHSGGDASDASGSTKTHEAEGEVAGVVAAYPTAPSGGGSSSSNGEFAGDLVNAGAPPGAVQPPAAVPSPSAVPAPGTPPSPADVSAPSLPRAGTGKPQRRRRRRKAAGVAAGAPAGRNSEGPPLSAYVAKNGI